MLNTMKQSTLDRGKYIFPEIYVIESETEECIAASVGQGLNDYDNNNLLDDDEDFN